KSYTYNFDMKNIKTLNNLFVLDKRNEAISLIKSITKDIILYENTSINEIKNYYFKILMSISKVSIDIGSESEYQDKNSDFFWDIISKANTIFQIEKYIISKLNQIFDYKINKNNYSGNVFNIIRYIQNNYSDVKLSILKISNYTYLTPNHMCLIFKKETGKTINQFITELRIEKSKDLLKDKKLKLYEISINVGYCNQNYFTKIFKKNVGLNPSEYRGKYLI
ncbi:MAG: helix-turn-helix domain-containing protein, partial [Clostridiales bacterium]